MKRKKTAGAIVAVVLSSILLSGFSSIEIRAEKKAQNGETLEQADPVAVKKRVRPVKEGETLTGIAKDVYGDSSYAELLYSVNKNMIGESPDYLQAGTYLALPEAPERGLKWKSLYENAGTQEEWDVYEAYCGRKAPYSIEEHYFYKNPGDEVYGRWESGEEVFDICYPQIVFADGRDATLVNIAIRDCAMRSADTLYLHPSDSLMESCRYDERYDFSWLKSTVHYQITYRDEHLLSVAFQDVFFVGSIFAESCEMRSITVNLDTGHVYTKDELFTNKEELAEKVHDKLKAQYTEGESFYEAYEEVMNEELLTRTLESEEWLDSRYSGILFLDGNGIRLGLSYRYNANDLIWRGYDTASFTPEEIAKYQSDSEFWQLWNGGKEQKDGKVEDYFSDNVWELKEYGDYIHIYSNGTKHLSFSAASETDSILNKEGEYGEYYAVGVAEADEEKNTVTQWFYVSEDLDEILWYDIGNEQYLTLEEWRNSDSYEKWLKEETDAQRENAMKENIVKRYLDLDVSTINSITGSQIDREGTMSVYSFNIFFPCVYLEESGLFLVCRSYEEGDKPLYVSFYEDAVDDFLEGKGINSHMDFEEIMAVMGKTEIEELAQFPDETDSPKRYKIIYERNGLNYIFISDKEDGSRFSLYLEMADSSAENNRFFFPVDEDGLQMKVNCELRIVEEDFSGIADLKINPVREAKSGNYYEMILTGFEGACREHGDTGEPECIYSLDVPIGFLYTDEEKICLMSHEEEYLTIFKESDGFPSEEYIKEWNQRKADKGDHDGYFVYRLICAEEEIKDTFYLTADQDYVPAGGMNRDQRYHNFISAAGSRRTYNLYPDEKYSGGTVERMFITWEESRGIISYKYLVGAYRDYIHFWVPECGDEYMLIPSDKG